MSKRSQIAQLLTDLDVASPAGFAIGLHIEYSTPRFMFQTYPKKWLEIYSSKGLLLHDPVVQWGFSDTGYVRWRDLTDDDNWRVMEQAARYGMRYGVTISTNARKSRSIGGFARSDRDYLDVEIDELQNWVAQLHEATYGVPALSQSDIAALKGMSDRLTRY